MRNIVIFCIFLTSILAIRFLNYYSTKTEYREGQKVVLEQTLLDEPKVYGNSQVFYADGLKVVAGRFPEFSYGDTIKISGIIGKQISGQKNRLINKKETIFVKNPKIELVKNNKGIILSAASFIRQKTTSTFDKYLGKNESALLAGIVLGLKQGFDSDFYQMLKSAGVLHVVAASGMNVTMAGGFLEGIFASFLSRRLAIIITILGILFYAVLSGLNPSIIRASVMASFTYGAALLGRQSYSYLSLFVTGFLMLFVSPYLIGDVGFQLSFLSTFGILSVKPLLSGLSFIKKGSGLGLADDFTTTVSAQIGSLPVLLAAFGTYQPMSIIINVVVLWTIPILMLLGGIAAIFSLFAPFVSAVFLYLSYPFLLFFKSAVFAFSYIFKPSEIGNILVVMVAGYYMVLVAAVLYFNKKIKD